MCFSVLSRMHFSNFFFKISKIFFYNIGTFLTRDSHRNANSHQVKFQMQFFPFQIRLLLICIFKIKYFIKVINTF